MTLGQEDTEIWVPLKDFEDLYHISSHGRLKSLRRKKNQGILSPRTTTKFGHQMIGPTRGGVRVYLLTHRVVAEHFIGASDLFINHKDHNPANNRVSNLEYVTVRENTNHGNNLKTLKYPRGVQKEHSRFRADVSHNKKRIYLGSFLTEEAAKNAYIKYVSSINEGKYAS